MRPDLLKQQAHRAVQKRLGYKFRNVEPSQQVLTHRSYNAKHNERFEFVGDSTLNYPVARMLFNTFPKLLEDELSQVCMALVNEGVLAETALEMNADGGLYLGVGELESGGFRWPSILVDAMEAMFAAVSFDADFSAAEKMVRHLSAERVKRASLNVGKRDSKTVLQEILRARCFALPKYRIEEQAEQTADMMFVIPCDPSELGFTCNARGSNRKVAERKAACEALEQLEQKFPLKKSKK